MQKSMVFFFNIHILLIKYRGFSIEELKDITCFLGRGCLYLRKKNYRCNILDIHPSNVCRLMKSLIFQVTSLIW